MSGEIDMLRQQRDHLDSLHRQLLQTKNDLQADNTQLCKEVESIKEKLDKCENRRCVLETAQAACLGERDAAIGEAEDLRAQVESLKVDLDIEKKLHEKTTDYWERAINERDRAESELTNAHADRAVMRSALQNLYDETGEYIELNNLGDPHHNQSMKDARSALSTDAGRDLLDRYREAVELLREASVDCKSGRPMTLNWGERTDTLLATVKGEVES